MSYCEEKGNSSFYIVGKDKITFLSRKDFLDLPKFDDKTSKALFAEDNESKGAILPDGSINWHCPCLGNMASGPCADVFIDAFSCFHNSSQELKGSDCLQQFSAMQECFLKYPQLFGDHDHYEEKGGNLMNQAAEEAELKQTTQINVEESALSQTSTATALTSPDDDSIKNTEKKHKFSLRESPVEIIAAPSTGENKKSQKYEKYISLFW